MASGIRKQLNYKSGLGVANGGTNPLFQPTDAFCAALSIPGIRYWFRGDKVPVATSLNWSGPGSIRDTINGLYFAINGNAIVPAAGLSGNLTLPFDGTNYIIGPAVFPTVATGFTGDYTKYFVYTTNAALPPAAGHAMICGNGASYHALFENLQGRIAISHNATSITQTVGSVLTRSTTYLVEQTYTAGGQTKVFLYKAGAPNNSSVLDTQSTGSPAFLVGTDSSVIVGAYASGLVGKPSFTCYEGGVVSRDMSVALNAPDRALILLYLKTEYGMLV